MWFVCLWLAISGQSEYFTNIKNHINRVWIQISIIASIYGVVDSYAFLCKAFLLSPFLVFNFTFYSTSIDHSHCWRHFFDIFREQSTSFFLGGKHQRFKMSIVHKHDFHHQTAPSLYNSLAIVSFVLHSIVEALQMLNIKKMIHESHRCKLNSSDKPQPCHSVKVSSPFLWSLLLLFSRLKNR